MTDLREALFLVVDTETTGNIPGKDEAIQVAVALMSVDNLQIYVSGSRLCKPTIPITAGASAVHHILDEDVVDAPNLVTVLKGIGAELADKGKPHAYAAHNAPFDASMLPINKAPWLCTLRMARKLYPAVESHKNQVLRYALKLPVPRSNRGHNAAEDVQTTSMLLQRMLQTVLADDGMPKTLEDLLAWVDAPFLIENCPLTKHKGKPWAQVVKDDPEYCKWVLSEDFRDLNPDTRHTILHWRDIQWPNGWPARKGLR
jgi:exodeoxyribonuclease X